MKTVIILKLQDKMEGMCTKVNFYDKYITMYSRKRTLWGFGGSGRRLLVGGGWVGGVGRGGEGVLVLCLFRVAGGGGVTVIG